MPTKLEGFAESILKGHGRETGPSRQDVPKEIIQDDRNSIYATLNVITRNSLLPVNQTYYEIDLDLKDCGLGTFKRGLNLDHDCASQLRKHCTRKPGAGRPDLSTIRNAIVGSRLGIAPETAKRLPGKDRSIGDEISDRPLFQAHLASIYLDVAASDADLKYMSMILDALGASRYPPLSIYYLVQTAKRVPSVPSPTYIKTEVDRFCKAVYQKYPNDACPSFRAWQGK